MKISKRKRQLAQLLIEAGVTKFPRGADWAAQDKGGAVCTYDVKPVRDAGDCYWDCKDGGVCSVYCYYEQPIPCWHQTVLSREEFDCIVAQTELDADGWIEWSGVPRSPVSKGTQVDVKMQNGTQHFGQLIDDECWSDCWGDANIIAYRPHKTQKSEPQYCESVTRSIHEPIAAPTIEQLAADYRNAKDYAERKQQEADAAKADADSKLTELIDAGEDLGLMVSPITGKQEPELVIAVQVGDEVECVESNINRDKYNGMVGRLRTIDESDTSTPYLVDFGGEAKIWCHKVKFIRRP